MTRLRLIPLALVALLPAAADAVPDDAFNRTIHRKLAEGGSWFAPDEQAFIRANCGAEQKEGRSLTIDGDEMICADGRVVRDPRVRAISRAVTARANARVKAVMASAEVRAAMERTVSARVREALALANARLNAAARTDR